MLCGSDGLSLSVCVVMLDAAYEEQPHLRGPLHHDLCGGAPKAHAGAGLASTRTALPGHDHQVRRQGNKQRQREQRSRERKGKRGLVIARVGTMRRLSLGAWALCVTAFVVCVVLMCDIHRS